MTALQWAEHVSPAIVGRGATLSAPREFERTGKLSVRNPRTGVVDFEFIPPTRTVLASIAQRLRGAQVRWATLPLAQRIDSMHGLRRELVARRKELVAALVEDTGRDVVAVAELASTLALIDRWCALVPRLSVQDETQSCAVDSPVVLSRYVPHPLVGVVSSYQRPLTMALLDAIPALLAGCAVQVMPGESAPRFCFPLSDCIAQVKPLSDVLAIAPGAPDRAEALIEQADVICFNGEMPAAHSVAEYAARHAIPIYTESAGRAPAIVTANVDLDIAARVVARASWLSTGHERQPIERVYVDHRVATAFIEKLVAHATRIRHDPAAKSCGLGLVGPFIRHEHVGSTAIQMADAVARGARVWCGGRIEVAGGHWLSPTIVTDFDRQAQIMRETIYGPLLPVTSFRDLEEAANLVNESPNCRSAAILARTLKEARDFARRLHATSISLNDSIVESAILDTGSYSVLAPGTGCSSTGESAYLRFLRRQILLCTHGDAQPSVLGEPDP